MPSTRPLIMKCTNGVAIERTIPEPVRIDSASMRAVSVCDGHIQGFEFVSRCESSAEHSRAQPPQKIGHFRVWKVGFVRVLFLGSWSLPGGRLSPAAGVLNIDSWIVEVGL
jgi:hypothetical protein